jgi:hypothetical protein
MVFMGFVRIAARRRVGTETGSFAPSRMDIVLHDLRRTEVSEARRRGCGHVVMVFLQGE